MIYAWIRRNQRGIIAVDNWEFSTFSTDFSTTCEACGHPGGYSFLVHIIFKNWEPGTFHFLADVVFAYDQIFVQKVSLDKRLLTRGKERTTCKKTEKRG